MILQLDQKVEDYIMDLNRNGQFGSVLYANRDLVVPDRRGDKYNVRCPVGEIERMARVCIRGEDFWKDLNPTLPLTEGKQLLYTFEAISAAVYAFQFSFPAICLDACTIKCPHTKNVLLTATFQTTEGFLLTMCYGTAPSESNESWLFFLINLRHVLRKFCSSRIVWRKLVAMSDRHQGLLNGVKVVFPEALHLYCTVHILRDILKKGLVEGDFWNAVEAHTTQLFDKFFSKIPLSVRQYDDLCDARHWSRIAIYEADYKRFSLRNTNWAECQNSALIVYRDGPVYCVLDGCFKYTTRKVSALCSRAEQYRRTAAPGDLTEYAIRLVLSNREYVKYCHITQHQGDMWQVTEFGKVFNVCTRKNEVSCSCLRYFDEEIPCQHILCIASLEGHRFSAFDLVGDIYSKQNFIQAFPQGLLFYPNDCEFHNADLNVIAQNVVQGRGAYQKNRFASPNEFYTSNCQSHRVSQARPRCLPAPAAAAAAAAVVPAPAPAAAAAAAVPEPLYDLESVQDSGVDEHQVQYIPPLTETDREIMAFEDRILEFDLTLARRGTIDDGTQTWREMLDTFLHAPRLFEADDEEVEPQLSDSHTDSASGRGTGVEVNLVSAVEEDIDQSHEEGDDDSDDAPEINPVELDVPQESHIPPSSASYVRENPQGDIHADTMPGNLLDDDDDDSHRHPHHNNHQTNIPATNLASNAPATSQPSSWQSLPQLPLSKVITRGPTSGPRRIALERSRGKKRPRPFESKKLRMQFHLLPSRLQRLVQNPKYEIWKNYYVCTRVTDVSLVRNELPRQKNSIMIGLTVIVPLATLPPEVKNLLCYIAEGTDCDGLGPSLSLDLLSSCLGYVHAFTALDIKAQAVGYSFNADGVIKYLQIPDIHDRDVSIPDEVRENFRAVDLADDCEEFIQRCWIYTRPTYEPYMTAADVYQLYVYTCKYRPFFAIILSPREGIKALFIHLTDAGIDQIHSFVSEAAATAVDTRCFAIERIKASGNRYCEQIPVTFSIQGCLVEDSRNKDDIGNQLIHSVGTGERTWWQ